MDPIAVADAHQRLDNLERSGRLWKSACFALICAITVVWTEGASLISGKASLETQSLTIRDADGQVRVRFAAQDYGDASLKLMNPEGEDLVDLSSSRDGSAVLSLSSDKRLRVTLASISDGSASFNFYDDRQTIVNSLYYRPGMQGGLAMRSIDTVPYMNAKATV